MSYFFSRQLNTDFVDAEKRVVRQLEEEAYRRGLKEGRKAIEKKPEF